MRATAAIGALVLLALMVNGSPSFWRRNRPGDLLRNHGTPFGNYDYAFRVNICKQDDEPKFRAIHHWGETSTIGNKLFYGEKLTLVCSAKSPVNLTIEREGICLQTTQLDTSTIELDLKIPDVGEYIYYCKDRGTGCENFVMIYVTPKLSIVTSPRGYFTARSTAISGPTAGYASAFVPIGETYEIHCSGNEAGSLIIYHVVGEYGVRYIPLQTETINNTAVKYWTKAESVVEEDKYSCKTENYHRGQGITVITDYYPEAQNFQCIIYDGRRELECKWNTSSKRNTFKISYLEDRDTVVCIENSGKTTRVCSWNIYKNVFTVQNPTSLLLQSCNEFFCNNQTFEFEYASILILAPPTGLKLLNVSSDTAAVRWRCPDAVNGWDMQFKVEYRQPSAAWQQVTTQSVPACTEHEFQLNLPCPGAHYELRVYAKHPETYLHGDIRLWSEPSASLFFFTSPQKSGGVKDPECDVEFDNKEPPPSVDKMLFEVRQLMMFERKKESALKEAIRGLEGKLLKAEALVASLAKSSAKGSEGLSEANPSSAPKNQ